MNIAQQILFFISALGAFNGIVLGLYLFFRKKKRTLATTFLFIMLLAISIRVGKSVFVYFNPTIPRIYLQVGLSACFLIGPAVYYFFRSALMNVTQIPHSWKWIWGTMAALIILVAIFIPYASYPAIWNGLIVHIIYYQWAGYLVLTGFFLRKVLKSFFVKASGLNDTEKFWVMLYLGNCIIYLAYFMSFIGIRHGIYISGPLFFSVLLYLTVFLNSRGVQFEDAPQNGKPEKRKIADADALAWIEKLENTLQQKELYKDPNLKLNDLAKHINISVHHLSQLLNDNLGKSFSTYINEYRITEACNLIRTNDRLTFEAIGYEVGYNSKSTFYTAFRKIKDTTPALYKEGLETNP